MILTTTFKIKGMEYSLSLDTAEAKRNEADENYALWVMVVDKKVLEITVWKDDLGRFTQDGVVEIHKNKADYKEGLLSDKKKIKVRKT